MMSHRKSHSSSGLVCNVPFSWEEKPGIPKFSSLSTDNLIKQPLQRSFSSHFHSPLNMMFMSYDYHMKVSPPPQMAKPPRRTPSMKGLWTRRQDDPFAAAIKECTKSSGSKKYGGTAKDRNQNIIFSCKRSCDVKEGNLVSLDNLPPLPRGRNKGHSR